MARFRTKEKKKNKLNKLILYVNFNLFYLFFYIKIYKILKNFDHLIFFYTYHCETKHENSFSFFFFLSLYFSGLKLNQYIKKRMRE